MYDIKRWIRPLLAALVLPLILTVSALPALAGGLEDGVDAYNQGDYAKALAAWMPLAEQGDPTAQFNIGVLHEFGQGVPESVREAAKWFRKAADQGDPYAQTELGVIYYNGIGVPQDKVAAERWFKLAADQGHPDGEYFAGIMAEEKGLRDEAMDWLHKAAEHGHTGAMDMIEQLKDNPPQSKGTIPPADSSTETPTD